MVSAYLFVYYFTASEKLYAGLLIILTISGCAALASSLYCLVANFSRVTHSNHEFTYYDAMEKKDSPSIFNFQISSLYRLAAVFVLSNFWFSNHEFTC